MAHYPDLNPNPAPSAPPMPSTTTPLYPTIDMSDLVENLFPDPHDYHDPNPITSPPPTQQTLVQIPGVILHLIDTKQSVELAAGELTIVRLLQGDNHLAVLACVGPDVQWPLTRDGAAVKLDASHYFFTLRVPPEDDEAGSPTETLNYGLTLASKGQEVVLHQLDAILHAYCNFSVQKVVVAEAAEVLEDRAIEIVPEKVVAAGPDKQTLEKKSAAYWTTLAPNVEDYSGSVAKAITTGSGKLAKGILWCGDVTVERIKWGNEYLITRMKAGESDAEVSPETLRRIKRVKRVTKMSEKVATGILSGVVKVSGFIGGSVANSKTGKKILSLVPGEIVLASLDGFGKICDAVEVAGKNVLSTSSTVTTGLVSHRYGEKAAHATNEGMDAAGHAIGTAWAVFKIRKALDPRSTLKPTMLAKSAVKAAAAEIKASKKK
ncbi:Senescence/dehydration-associated-like protein [Rhynchospora pubera]|uniref:Senescence/dehydration-associated-like protein n=1 Tax=Rhynchospora pubera TaxID=906938 RepID=A0AAV8EA65_9POAL|nr:Senescence/dehydration-associated-like protein [Rhynchospora pubera]